MCLQLLFSYLHGLFDTGIFGFRVPVIIKKTQKEHFGHQGYLGSIGDLSRHNNIYIEISCLELFLRGHDSTWVHPFKICNQRHLDNEQTGAFYADVCDLYV